MTSRQPDHTPLGKTFRRAEILRLRAMRERLAHRLDFAETAQDTAATRAEGIRRELADVLRQLDAIEAGR
jgi:hypothetical protein